MTLERTQFLNHYMIEFKFNTLPLNCKFSNISAI